MKQKTEKENYIIRLRTSIDVDGDPQKIDLMTRGNFVYRNGSYFISYKDTETTGYVGCTTTLKVAEDGTRAVMHRSEPVSSHLIIERGRRNVCHYETGCGSLTLGVTADEIDCQLTEKGGTLRLSYFLDADNTMMVSRNRMEIHVTHLN